MRSILASLLVLSLAGEASAQTVPPAPVAAANGAPAASALAAPGFKIARAGTQAPVKGAAETFTGSVRLDPLFQAREPMNISGSYVTFEPGARTAWHSHPLGQILVVTAGTGLIQMEGGPIGQGQAVPAVSLDPVSRLLGDQRGGEHLAVQVRLHQLPVQPIAAGASFVAKGKSGPLRLDRGGDLGGAGSFAAGTPATGKSRNVRLKVPGGSSLDGSGR
jgi:hypothetical protein